MAACNSTTWEWAVATVVVMAAMEEMAVMTNKTSTRQLFVTTSPRQATASMATTANLLMERRNLDPLLRATVDKEAAIEVVVAEEAAQAEVDSEAEEVVASEEEEVVVIEEEWEEEDHRSAINLLPLALVDMEIVASLCTKFKRHFFTI